MSDELEKTGEKEIVGKLKYTTIFLEEVSNTMTDHTWLSQCHFRDMSQSPPAPGTCSIIPNIGSTSAHG